MDLPTTTAASARRDFVRFYREQFAFAWRTLVRLGVPRADCDDAVQDVFVVAHRRWFTVRDPDHRRSWLGGIVRRIASRYRRTTRRRTRRHDALAAAPHEVPRLEDELARREAWRTLARFLDDLDEAKREAFVLGELESLSKLELGAALGVNPNTAYSRLLAARRSFVQRFGELDQGDCARIIADARAQTEPGEASHAVGREGLAAIVGAKLPLGAALVKPWLAAAALVSFGTALAIAAVPAAPPSTVGPTEPTTRAPEPRSAAVVPRTLATGSSAPAPSATVLPPTPAPRRARAPTSDATPPSKGDELGVDAEIATLLLAREALVAGDPAAARRHIDEHRRRFGEHAALVDARAQIERELAEASRSSESPR